MKNPWVLLLIVLSCGWAQAENWPRFRGPTGQGLSSETNLPLHWSPTSTIFYAQRDMLADPLVAGTCC